MFSEKDFNQFFRYCIALERDETEAYDLLQDSLEKFLRKGSAAKDLHLAVAPTALLAVEEMTDSLR